MGKVSYTVDLDNLPQELQMLYDFIITDIMEEYIKYYTFNNIAAGKRLRKNTMTLKKFAMELRKNVRESLSNEEDSS